MTEKKKEEKESTAETLNIQFQFYDFKHWAEACKWVGAAKQEHTIKNTERDCHEMALKEKNEKRNEIFADE